MVDTTACSVARRHLGKRRYRRGRSYEGVNGLDFEEVWPYEAFSSFEMCN